ncbi:dihydroneopterin aldolase [Salinibacillus xinjiangensis]|uniref:7,8-dihydroneopterin aldolase n=1 Tax=Salinibacillus xinjiangensis TaxID=1229268 RepID=A0A6G1XBN1_9BACI|nr:dihydroneopterin aldolase [Salinibacillus xinjiangensis]MRG88198.1 dihydroneopterin aldolase [Salinibacillus xinjiangensis]
MDKVFVKGMKFYGYHGLYPEEKKLGQRYQVDLTIEHDLKQAGQTDQMADSIDYGRVYEVTKRVVEGRAKNLVEALAEDIANQMFITFPSIKGITINVQKPEAPIPGQFEAVGVEIYRENS